MDRRAHHLLPRILFIDVRDLYEKFRRSATCIQLLTWWRQLTQHPWSKWELSDVEFDTEWRYCKRCGAMENRRIGPPPRHWNCRCEITPLEHE